MATGNIKVNKFCVFCKHWYDPTNSAIKPKAPNIGLWEFDNHAKSVCTLNNMQRPAVSTCPKFSCKL